MPKSDSTIGLTVETGDRGVPALCKDSNTKYQVPSLDASGNIKVNVAAGGTSGTQYADGDVRGTATGNLSMVDDGTNIQSMKGDSSGRPQINIDQVAGVNAVSGSGIATGALRVELPTNGTGVIATVGAVTAITNALPAGNNNIGDMDVASIAAGTNKIGDVDIAPRTTGGWLVANFTSGDTYTALTNSAQAIKASAGKFGGYYIYNPNASATYVLIYNIAAASVTVGTSTALLVFCIPATSAANLELIAGIPFSNAGWSIAAATTGGGNTAPATALEAMVFYV